MLLDKRIQNTIYFAFNPSMRVSCRWHTNDFSLYKFRPSYIAERKQILPCQGGMSSDFRRWNFNHVRFYQSVCCHENGSVLKPCQPMHQILITGACVLSITIVVESGQYARRKMWCQRKFGSLGIFVIGQHESVSEILACKKTDLISYFTKRFFNHVDKFYKSGFS